MINIMNLLRKNFEGKYVICKETSLTCLGKYNTVFEGVVDAIFNDSEGIIFYVGGEEYYINLEHCYLEII
jgi:hypothetical protein